MKIDKNRNMSIKTEVELEDFINNIFIDFKLLEDTKIYFDKELFCINLKIKGEKYNATITTSVMKYILDIQNCFYKLFKQYTGKFPNRLERQKLEISTTVEKGSSNIITSVFDQLNVIQEVIQNMTGTQTLVAIISGFIAWSLVKIHSKHADSYDKKIIAEAEIEKAKTQNIRDKEFFDAIIGSIKVLTLGRTQGLKDLSKIDGATTIEIDNKVLSKNELSERIKELSLTEEEVIATEEGEYKILEITMNFEKNSAKATLINHSTMETLHNVVIQTKSIIDGSYSILKKAQSKELVKMQLITVRQNNEIIKTTFDKLL